MFFLTSNFVTYSLLILNSVFSQSWLPHFCPPLPKNPFLFHPPSSAVELAISPHVYLHLRWAILLHVNHPMRLRPMAKWDLPP